MHCSTSGWFSVDSFINTCLEHIEDDTTALSIMGTILSQGGKIIICVPAISSLYCNMDKNVGHFRRYARGELKQKAVKAGLQVIDSYYMNLLGIIPYWIKGRLNYSASANDSFSSSITKNESKLYSLATSFLEPIERVFRPVVGISEFIILRKPV